MKTIGFIALGILLASGAVHGGVIYNAGLGTLPQAQGWIYSGDFGNPSPFVSAGALHEVKNVPGTAQYWTAADTLDITRHVYIQGVLEVNSSNEVPNVGTGTREGYYFFFTDANGFGYSVGLADAGFNINTVEVPNHPLTPFRANDGFFHTYTLDVNNSLASFSVDGVLKASGITPYFIGSQDGVNNVKFGAAAGASISDTNLRSVCETTVGSCSVASAAPEPSTVALCSAFLLPLAALARRRVRAS
jgi:hypothetical protein